MQILFYIHKINYSPTVYGTHNLDFNYSAKTDEFVDKFIIYLLFFLVVVFSGSLYQSTFITWSSAFCKITESLFIEIPCHFRGVIYLRECNVLIWQKSIKSCEIIHKISTH